MGSAGAVSCALRVRSDPEAEESVPHRIRTNPSLAAPERTRRGWQALARVHERTKVPAQSERTQGLRVPSGLCLTRRRASPRHRRSRPDPALWYGDRHPGQRNARTNPSVAVCERTSRTQRAFTRVHERTQAAAPSERTRQMVHPDETRAAQCTNEPEPRCIRTNQPRAAGLYPGARTNLSHRAIRTNPTDGAPERNPSSAMHERTRAAPPPIEPKASGRCRSLLDRLAIAGSRSTQAGVGVPRRCPRDRQNGRGAVLPSFAWRLAVAAAIRGPLEPPPAATDSQGLMDHPDES